MNEIYWITRLDYIQVMFGVCTLVVAFAIIVIGSLLLLADDEDETKKIRKYLKTSLCCFPFLVLPFIFIPSTKEVLLIYGLGGTIDYIKDSDTAKKLPDKVIMALDKYLDELNKDKKEEK